MNRGPNRKSNFSNSNMTKKNKTPSSLSRGMHREDSPENDWMRVLNFSLSKTTLSKNQTWSTSKNYLGLRERSTMAKCHQGRSNQVWDMATASRSGQMVRPLEATGKTTWWRKGRCLPLWASTQVNLNLTRLGDSGCSMIRLLVTKGSLLQTWWRDLVF